MIGLQSQSIKMQEFTHDLLRNNYQNKQKEILSTLLANFVTPLNIKMASLWTFQIDQIAIRQIKR